VRMLPFPTITFKGFVGFDGRFRNLAKRFWTKLWVLPPSIRTVTGWLASLPEIRIVAGSVLPAIA
jgi:hypothetical protein